MSQQILVGRRAWRLGSRLQNFAGLANAGTARAIRATPFDLPFIARCPAPFGEDTLATVAGAEDGPAWERRNELGFVKALTQTWKEVLFNPTVSFSRMKTSGGFAAPFLFNLMMVVI